MADSGRPGVPERLRDVLDYVAPRVPSSAHLRIVTARSDFHAYGQLGEALIGCGWRKSAEFAYPDGMTVRSWERLTRRVWRSHQPWWACLAGRLVAAVVIVRSFR